MNVVLALAVVLVTSSVDEAAQRTRVAVEQVMQDNSVPAISIAVALQGEVIYAEAFGDASVEPSVPATPDTRFGIGSITKSLTLALVQVMVDRGELEWDRPIETWLEGFVYAGHGMTLRHIGAHQSGINEDAVGALRFTDVHYGTDEAVSKLIQGPLDFKPGTQTRYGTGSFNVIAQVIERVTGDPFVKVLAREVLQPAHMDQTTVLDPCVDTADLATFYEPRDEGLEAVVVDPSFKRAGAGYVSTASDLVRFGMALAAGHLCDTAELFAVQTTSNGVASEFGLGWRVTEDGERFVVYQPGGGPGISSYLVIYPDQSLVWAIVCNETAASVGGVIMEESLAGFLALTD